MKFIKPSLGSVFFERVRVQKKRPTIDFKSLRGWGARLTIFYLLLIVAFFSIWLRLFHLTVVLGKENRILSEDNRTKLMVLHAPRGVIFDRQGIPLVKNEEAFRVVEPCEKNCKSILKPANKVAEENQGNIIYKEQDYLRTLLYPYETAHLIGYLGEISADEINDPQFVYQGYLLGDRLGRSGVEQIFEKELRGKDGKELIEVDANGGSLRSLGKVDAISGKDIFLSIDSSLQNTAYLALGEQPGAVVVSKPKTGEILALVSTPSFDVNKINYGISGENFLSLVNSVDQPMFNRAVGGVYPPGSVFKPLVAIAAMESKSINDSTMIEDTGKLTVGAFSFANWFYTQYGRTDGMVDLKKALARSNDIYFYKIGEMTKVEVISEWGKKFGFGQKTGIQLPHEAEGVMPDRAWRNKIRNQEWYLGDTYHLAIGQGDLLATPLQINTMISALANNGIWCQPTLLSLSQNEGIESKNIPKCKSLDIHKNSLNEVIEGMRRTCLKDLGWGYQGTGWPLFDFSVEVKSPNTDETQRKSVPLACKTGTAEFGDSQNKTHAWFTAFAPLTSTTATGSAILGEPEIAVTVLVEKGGEGSSVAAPIAKKILENWFSR